MGSEDEVRNVKPDFQKIAALEGLGVSVTAKAEGKTWDYVSRYFAPSVGINEVRSSHTVPCFRWWYPIILLVS